VIAITFHEVAHGYAAYRLGDSTAKLLGRLTLNPIKHVDPFGTVVLPLLLWAFSGGSFVFGYAKPVPIGVRNFKDPRRDMAITGAAGPLMNIALAIVSAWLLKALIIGQGAVPVSVLDPLVRMFRASVFINAFLAALNLIPIPPLDGGRVASGLLPRDLAMRYDRIEPYGFFIVIILLVTNLADLFILPVVRFIIGIINILS
jgi:Zn-dependent protease